MPAQRRGTLRHLCFLSAPHALLERRKRLCFDLVCALCLLNLMILMSLPSQQVPRDSDARWSAAAGAAALEVSVCVCVCVCVPCMGVGED